MGMAGGCDNNNTSIVEWAVLLVLIIGAILSFLKLIGEIK